VVPYVTLLHGTVGPCRPYAHTHKQTNKQIHTPTHDVALSCRSSRSLLAASVIHIKALGADESLQNCDVYFENNNSV